MRWKALACLGLLGQGALLPVAAAMEVDLELVLAVDVSGSMDAEEQAVQRQGYSEALLRPEVLAAIRSGPLGRIAVAYVEWAGTGAQAVVVPWTPIADAATAKSFVATLDDAPPGRRHGTSISGALAFAAPLFDGNGYEGPRRVIDISGDGANNMGPPVMPARDAVVAAGIVINGLPIAIRPSGGWFGLDGPELVAYYRDCVIGGPGAFVLPVTEAGPLAEAIRQKLVREIAGRVPRPLPAAVAGGDCLVGERQRRIWEREP